jgi:hypothetical protein
MPAKNFLPYCLQFNSADEETKVEAIWDSAPHHTLTLNMTETEHIVSVKVKGETTGICAKFTFLVFDSSKSE